MHPRNPGDFFTLHKPLCRAAALLTLPLLTACGLFGGGSAPTSQPAPTPSVFGYAVADEPQAALAARHILNLGGNAADAAAAEGFALAVTLPSRAGLGGGGACIIKMPAADGTPQPAVTLSFAPGAPAAAGGARPAAVPSLARGLLALQARYGTLPYPAVIVPAERLAANATVSPALAADLQIVGPALLADPAAAAIFGANGGVLPSGAALSQPDLATTLEIIRAQGVQGFYAGDFASQFLAAANQAGGNLSARDFSAALPAFGTPATSTQAGADIAALPTPATTAQSLPASAAFMALDKNGGIVACDVTMNNLFGTGRIAPGTGVLLAASPRAATPILAAAIATSGDKFRAAVTGTGQAAAGIAASTALNNALTNANAPIPEPGRANTISCPAGIPGGENSCTATADPRANGLAIGGP